MSKITDTRPITPGGFFPRHPGDDFLFRVCDGVPVVEALATASAILTAAHSIAEDCGETSSSAMDMSEQSWGVVYLIRMAQALIKSATATVA